MPSLRLQLLFQLVFLAGAAVLTVGLCAVLLAGGDPAAVFLPLLVLWTACTAVVVLFGSYLMKRYVLGPLVRLAADADALALGDLSRGGSPYESRELAQLAAHHRAMAESLLDAQSHIVRVEKLAGIGRLAAGVAHEVRNPLGALSTYTEVLRHRGVAPDVTSEMQSAIGRIECTVKSLLDYARPGAPTGLVDLKAATETTLDFLEAQGLFRDHELAVMLEDVPCAAGDRHALEQVVLNLVVNACDVAPQSRVTVDLRPRRYDPRRQALPRESDPSGSLRHERAFSPRPRRPEIAVATAGMLLCVSDDGPGVSEEDRERIFDPFYTTKDPGKGVGLGLALVARTIHEVGGVVWVDRAREGGAAFKVFLPAAGRLENNAHPHR